jgi:hypothetical protein
LYVKPFISMKKKTSHKLQIKKSIVANLKQGERKVIIGGYDAGTFGGATCINCQTKQLIAACTFSNNSCNSCQVSCFTCQGPTCGMNFTCPPTCKPTCTSGAQYCTG